MRAAAALTVFTDRGCTVWAFYDAKLQTSLNASRRRDKLDVIFTFHHLL